MSVSRARGPPGRSGRPRRRRRPDRRLLRRAAGPGGGRPARRLRHLRAPRDLDGADVQRGPRPGDRRGDLPLPRASRASTGRCSSGATRTRCPSRRRRRIVEVLCAHGVDVRVDADDGFTPTPAISHAILTHNRGGGRGQADGIVVTPSHNPPEDGGVKYNPPHGGPADTDVTGWIERRGQRAARGRPARRQAHAATASCACAATTTCRPTSTTCRPSIDLERDPRQRAAARRRPAGRRERRLLGGDRRAPRPRPDDHQRRGRPDLPLRAARLGRQDPHGLLVAVRDGQADRAAPTASTSPSPTTPTPTATGSSRRAPGC